VTETANAAAIIPVASGIGRGGGMLVKLEMTVIRELNAAGLYPYRHCSKQANLSELCEDVRAYPSGERALGAGASSMVELEA
jgi:hypothetical protein